MIFYSRWLEEREQIAVAVPVVEFQPHRGNRVDDVDANHPGLEPRGWGILVMGVGRARVPVLKPFKGGPTYTWEEGSHLKENTYKYTGGTGRRQWRRHLHIIRRRQWRRHLPVSAAEKAGKCCFRPSARGFDHLRPHPFAPIVVVGYP